MGEEKTKHDGRLKTENICHYIRLKSLKGNIVRLVRKKTNPPLYFL